MIGPALYKLPGLNWKTRTSHGGSETKGNPREHRPVDTKQALHVVLRSSKAHGAQSFLVQLPRIESAIRRQASLFDIKIYRCSTPGNHVHILLKVQKRRDLGRFLRSVSGILARIALKAERGRPRLNVAPHTEYGTQEYGIQKFWDARPWSRIVHFGRDFRSVGNYIQQTSLEALGLSRLAAKTMVARVEVLLKANAIVVPGFS